MKYALVLLSALASCCAAAQQQPDSDLRQAVRQYHPADAAPPRHLTAEERAELRRQLAEFKRPPRAKR